MRKLLLKWIERLQKRVASKKDDPRDWEWFKKELDKNLIAREADMIVNLDRTDICNMLSGAEPSYEQMGQIERLGLGYYVGGFSDQWHWNKTGFEDFSDEDCWRYTSR